MPNHLSRSRVNGFTLIEVMMVIVIIGVMVAAVQINFFTNKPAQMIEQQASRFAGVFNLAAEYGLLNNVELGVVIEEDNYQFVGFDGVRWTPIPDEEILAKYDLPETLTLTLDLEDLPLDEGALFDAQTFVPDEEDIEQMREGLSDKEKPLIPQIYLLTGGEITPFRLVFSTEEDDVLSAIVIGHYEAPVVVTLNEDDEAR